MTSKIGTLHTGEGEYLEVRKLYIMIFRKSSGAMLDARMCIPNHSAAEKHNSLLCTAAMEQRE